MSRWGSGYFNKYHRGKDYRFDPWLQDVYNFMTRDYWRMHKDVKADKDPAILHVLDHGFVRLVDYMGDDLTIARSARVSYNADWRAGESAKDEKLIAYLLKNGHTSPFEAVVFTFEVKCPLFVARQWQRHRTWKYNEVSARYTELPEEYYVPELDKITKQSKDNKQMRTAEQHPDAFQIQFLIREECKRAFQNYHVLLEGGCPRELARGVLPLNTYTRYFATVDLHNLLHFLRLRLHEHAQYEIRVYGQAILEHILPIVPITLRHAFHDLAARNYA